MKRLKCEWKHIITDCTHQHWSHFHTELSHLFSGYFILWQLSGILWESHRLNSESSQASAPLQAEETFWELDFCAAWAQTNAASRAVRPLLSKDNCVSDDPLLSENVFIEADARHCAPATNASWHVIYLQLQLLLAVTKTDERCKSACVSAKWVFNLPVCFFGLILLDWNST